jgi:hypothetical protein
MSAPYLYSGGLPPNAAASGSLVLPANGGTVLIPVPNADLVQPRAVTLRTTDTNGQHTLQGAIYTESNGQFLLLGLPGSFTFTATVAANRTGTFTPFWADPGCLWVAVRNAGATTTALATAAAGALGGNLCLAATIPQINGVLDPADVIWTPSASLPIIRVECGTVILAGASL